jgi:hypothetical protein
MRPLFFEQRLKPLGNTFVHLNDEADVDVEVVSFLGQSDTRLRRSHSIPGYIPYLLAQETEKRMRSKKLDSDNASVLLRKKLIRTSEHVAVKSASPSEDVVMPKCGANESCVLWPDTDDDDDTRLPVQTCPNQPDGTCSSQPLKLSQCLNPVQTGKMPDVINSARPQLSLSDALHGRTGQHDVAHLSPHAGAASTGTFLGVNATPFPTGIPTSTCTVANPTYNHISKFDSAEKNKQSLILSDQHSINLEMGGMSPPDNFDTPKEVTTLMVRNLPLTTKQSDLLEELKRGGFSGLFDFLYMPCDFTSSEGRGFAFINFLTPAAAGMLVGAWHRSRRFGIKLHDQALSISPASLQGFEANVRKWDIPRMRRIRNPHLKPYMVMRTGTVDGPACTSTENSRGETPAP